MANAITRRYLKVFGKAWPSDLVPSQINRIEFQPHGDDFQTVHTGHGLPAPFHRGLRLSWLSGTGISYRQRHVAEDDAEWLGELLRNPAAAAAQIMVVSDRLHAHAKRSGMTCGMVMPVSLGIGFRGVMSVGCEVDITALDDAGNPVTKRHSLADYGMNKTGWREVASLANRQEERRAISGRRLIADPVTAAAIARMTDGGRRRLLDHLRAHPQTSGSEAGSVAPNWTEETLSPIGVTLPPDMETILVRNGRIVGRVRLGERSTWNAGKLLHRGTTIPATILAALAGQPLSRLVEGDMLPPGLIIEGIRMDGTGAVRAEISADLREVL